MFAGVALYGLLFLWESVIGEAPSAVFYCVAVTSAVLFLIGFIRVMTKKDDDLYSEIEKSMDDKDGEPKRRGMARYRR